MLRRALRSLSLLPLAAALLLLACGEDPCARVTCEGASVCAPSDGLCHCGAADGEVCAEGQVCEAEAGATACVVPLPEPVCGSAARWAPGTPAFREATEAWGLIAARAEGVRLNVADIDGDGYADLIVRRGGGVPDDFAEGGTRRTFVLRNTSGDGVAGFTDVTRSSGLLATRYSEMDNRAVEILAFADIDNDGDVDAYAGVSTADPFAVDTESSEVLLNDGTGVFTLGPESSAARRELSIDAPAGASFVDVDRDGALDLWVPQHNYTNMSGSFFYAQDRLYQGDGGGSFVDATEAFGLTTQNWTDLDVMNQAGAHTRAWGAAACDLNGDGYPELLAPSYGRSPNHLWQARPAGGSVTFENRSVAAGYAYDGSQTWQDNYFATCYCRYNPSAEACGEAEAPPGSCPPADMLNWQHSTDREPYRLGGNSGGTFCGDIDNDGDIDLLTTEIRHWWAGSGSDGSELLLNDGAADPVFARPGDAALGLAIDHSGGLTWDEGHMTGALFDFDNDGWPDVYIGGSDYAGNRGLLYHNQSTAPGAPSFLEVAPADGIDHNRSHGVVVADFDHDGDLDVVVGHSRARCDAAAPNNCYETSQVRYFENLTRSPGGEGAGGFLELHLLGTGGSNRGAVGARVTVTTTGSAGALTQTQEVYAGYGHYGAQSDMVLHFGLSDACEAQVTVRWPDAAGSTETFTLPAGHRYRVEQGGRPLAEY